jgi:hypothetical protein
MTPVLPSIFRYNQFHRDAWVAAEAKKIPAGSKVLDVGAGAGPYREIFAHCQYRTQDFGREPGTVGRYTALDYTSDPWLDARRLEDGGTSGYHVVATRA